MTRPTACHPASVCKLYVVAIQSLVGQFLMRQKMNSPKCRVFKPSTRYSKKVVRAVHFDGISLVIDIQGEGFTFARVVFHNPIGFRVLDESDLSELWNIYSEPNGWLYEVEEGGWMELESNREAFASQTIYEEKLHEYLIVDDKCINVLATTPPEIQDFGAKSK